MATRRNPPEAPKKKTSPRQRPAARVAKARAQRQPKAVDIEIVGPDDLVILGPTGKKFFWVKKEDYESTELPQDVTPQMSVLVGQGVVLADVPANSLPGVGCACLLMNLASLRKSSTKK
ncbi:hypothetical protein JYK02_08575 [Corallococcus macrosporus]|uniref:Uncharacterized protein n=1 Tax=Corallococcus macrosporus TaxID=35 RepID=A0ABS3DB33_9BACT|nr:hypothetical protein [Corallococcus macrosporus]MBN8227560.1 hypothetical protein [Corallococcus macrosporus]